jgi:type I restriction enzyme, S subunit
MSNSVPNGWGVKNLIDCSVNGISNGVFRDPKTVGEGYKLINVFEMYQGFGVDVNLTERLPLSDKEFQKNKVNYGDVFFTRSSLKLEGIAYCNINLSHDDDITYEGHLMRVVPDRNFVEPEYLARFCLSDEARIFFMSSAKHSSMTTISQSDIAPLKVLLPPLPEQQKIAAILTSVDDVIESTQAQINKLKDLKTGMMQELLTKGIGHTEFKDSPVGRIPKAWQVKKLAELVKPNKPITYGIVQTGEHIENGIPCVRVVDLMKEDLTTENMIKTSLDISNQFKRTVLEYGDIMFALRGEIGHVRIASENLVGANLTRGVALISPAESILNEYLLWVIRSGGVRENILDRVNGSALQEIPLGNLREVDIPVPEKLEQEKIVNALNSIEDRLNVHLSKLSSQQNVKKALMQDLLTGKVRVKVN